MINGLKKLPIDERDFSHSVVFGSLIELPKEDFKVCEPYEILQQGDSDFCSAFTIVGMTESRLQKSFSPHWQFAKEKQISGDYLEWGEDLRTALKAKCDFGSLPVELLPFDPKTKTRDELANPATYSKDLDWIASPYRSQSFFIID